MASQIIRNLLFVRQLFQANNKEIVNDHNESV